MTTTMNPPRRTQPQRTNNQVEWIQVPFTRFKKDDDGVIRGSVNDLPVEIHPVTEKVEKGPDFQAVVTSPDGSEVMSPTLSGFYLNTDKNGNQYLSGRLQNLRWNIWPEFDQNGKLTGEYRSTLSHGRGQGNTPTQDNREDAFSTSSRRQGEPEVKEDVPF